MTMIIIVMIKLMCAYSAMFITVIVITHYKLMCAYLAMFSKKCMQIKQYVTSIHSLYTYVRTCT